MYKAALELLHLVKDGKTKAKPSFRVLIDKFLGPPQPIALEWVTSWNVFLLTTLTKWPVMSASVMGMVHSAYSNQDIV